MGAVLIRCYGCRAMFNKEHAACPDCGTARRGVNGYLRTAQLNSHLYAQAESADNERKTLAAMRRGYEPDPPKWAKQRAKQIVSEL